MTPVFDVTNAVEVARLDDLQYAITLAATDLVTGIDGPLTTGPVTAHLSLWPPSLTPLPQSQATLQHVGNGRWLGSRDVPEVTAALAGLRDGTRLAMVYAADGTMARFREAIAVTMRRA